MLLWLSVVVVALDGLGLWACLVLAARADRYETPPGVPQPSAVRPSSCAARRMVLAPQKDEE